MAESLESDELSSLARHLAERVVTLCPHVPAGELAELTSRLALTEQAHATGVSLTDEESELETPPVPGNRVVWLPGTAGSAIILPAGEDPPTAGASIVQLLARARRAAQPLPAAIRMFRDTLRSRGRYQAATPTQARCETRNNSLPAGSR